MGHGRGAAEPSRPHRAKIRLADEYDAAQERGEIPKAGRPNSSQTEKFSAKDAGLSDKEIHDARQKRNAERAKHGVTDVMYIYQKPSCPRARISHPYTSTKVRSPGT